MIPANYDHSQVHKEYSYAHLQILKSLPSTAVAVKTEKTTKYPISLLIDEQNLSQNTSVHTDSSGHYVLGLTKTFSAHELSQLDEKGLRGLLDRKEVFYIDSVREYRLQDWGTIYCSNAGTFYESTTPNKISAEDYISQIQDVIKSSETCLSCFQANQPCEYEKSPTIDMALQCKTCNENNLICESLKVVLAINDMATEHIPANLLSHPNFLFIYGQLHINKAITRALRNWVLQVRNDSVAIGILPVSYTHLTLPTIE